MDFDKDLSNSGNVKDNITSSEERKKYDRIPIYPSKIQSTAFPERVYIFAVQKLILISILLFVISVILGILIYYKTFLFKPNPLFIYYSDYDKKFKTKNFYNPGGKSIYHNIQILAEDFLKNWIVSYYSIDMNNNINNSNWCNCLEYKPDTDKSDELYCSVCNSSDKNLYNIFLEYVKPINEERYKSGITRIVKILSIEPFFYGLINHNQAKQSILEEIALTSISAFKDSLSQIREKINLFRSYMFYIKMDFMTIDFKDGKKISTEYFTSYNTVSLRLFQNESGHLGVNKNWTNQFKVLEHSANFILHNKYKNVDISDAYRQYNKMLVDNLNITKPTQDNYVDKNTDNEKAKEEVIQEQKETTAPDNNIKIKSNKKKIAKKTKSKTNKLNR